MDSVPYCTNLLFVLMSNSGEVNVSGIFPRFVYFNILSGLQTSRIVSVDKLSYIIYNKISVNIYSLVSKILAQITFASYGS